jgi:site-specific recombinase XerC
VFVEEYWRAHAIPNLAPLTRDGYASRWENHIRPSLGGYPLRQITPLVVGQLAVDMRRKGVGEPTVRLTLPTLSSILSLAMRQPRISSNPVTLVKKPRPKALREAAPVAPVTVERLRSRLGLRDATIVSVFAYAGSGRTSCAR